MQKNKFKNFILLWNLLNWNFISRQITHQRNTLTVDKYWIITASHKKYPIFDFWFIYYKRFHIRPFPYSNTTLTLNFYIIGVKTLSFMYVHCQRKSYNLIIWNVYSKLALSFIFRAVFGPSGVHALPLAAGINVGGHYKWHFFSFSLSSIFRPIANSP